MIFQVAEMLTTLLVTCVSSEKMRWVPGGFCCYGWSPKHIVIGSISKHKTNMV